MKQLRVVLIMGLLLVIGLGWAEQGWAVTHVEPARLILHVEPGARRTGTIKVTNKGEEEIEVKAILYDWALDKKEALVTSQAGSRPETLAELIKFNPRQFKVGPGKTQVVRFTIRAPEDIEQERRGIVFFEEETGLVEEATGAKVVTQIGTAIYFVPTTAQSRFRLLAAKVETAAAEEENLGLLLVKNEGNAHIRYTINYKVINNKGAVIEDNKAAEKVILPQATRVAAFPITNQLASGEYKILLQIQFYGTDKTADYTLPFVVD